MEEPQYTPQNKEEIASLPKSLGPNVFIINENLAFFLGVKRSRREAD
jgi:hypothetical protein